MLVVVFDNEDAAHEGSRVLRKLDEDGYVAVYDAAIVTKNANGTATVKRGGKYGRVGTVTGLAVGGLIGLLAGPLGALGGALGAATGAVGGTLVGALSDFENVRVGSDFIADASKELAPGKAALVAEVDEDEITPVDLGMEDLGGTVLRRSLRELKHAENDQDIATTKAEIAHTKMEHAATSAERKAKLQARIDSLNTRLKLKIERAKARREAMKRSAEAKIEALKARAAHSRQEMKAKQEQRVALAKNKFHEWEAQIESELY
jgi:uncharacterized membrane protein